MKCPDAKHVFVSLAVLGAAGSPAFADANNANQVAQAIGKQISTQFLNHDGEHHGENSREEHHGNDRRDYPQHNEGRRFGNGERDNQQQVQHENHERAEEWQRQQQQEAYQHQRHEAREHSGWSNGWYVQRNDSFGQFTNRPLTYRFVLENDAEGWLDNDAYYTLDRWALANFDYYHWGRLDAREYEQSRRYFWRLADLNQDGFISNYEWRFFCNHYARQQYGYR